jgi:acetoin utilization deacetylase AcuC-like enzyme
MPTAPAPSLRNTWSRLLRRARRHARSLRQGLRDRRRGPCFVYHPAYAAEELAGPYDLHRPDRILHYLEREGLLRRGALHRPRPASLDRLRLVHTRAYLESLEAPDALTPIVGEPLRPELHDAFLAGSRAMVGGTLRATKLALRRGAVAVNLGGGFHHAHRDRGHGFSCFHDVAVAIATWRARGWREPVLVVDLDVHDGDGTRALFAQDPTVHTFSLHNRTLGTGEAVADTCVALGPDVDDPTLLAAVREHLPPVLAAVQPALVFYLAGSDGHRHDRLGNWRLDHAGLVARDQLVLGLLRDGAPRRPVVYLLAGGYGHHAWRHPAATFSWLLTGEAVIRPPLQLELPLDHYRRLRPFFAHPEPAAGGPLAEGWALTAEDLPGLGGVPSTQFLDAIPAHGLEVVLEKSGLLDRLRARGFRKLEVATDLRDPVGHLLRVVDVGGPAPRPLVELKLRRDLTCAPPYALLAVEWLLLQNARGAFVLGRPPLPGQRYPGLGLLRDVTAMLVVLCERLELDGLTFLPAHFHMADIAREAAVFWEPDAAARHAAVREALRGLRLPEMDRAVRRGEVIDTRTGQPYAFEPARMVLPVSARLQADPRIIASRTAATGDRVTEATDAAAPARFRRQQR